MIFALSVDQEVSIECGTYYIRNSEISEKIFPWKIYRWTKTVEIADPWARLRMGRAIDLALLTNTWNVRFMQYAPMISFRWNGMNKNMNIYFWIDFIGSKKYARRASLRGDYDWSTAKAFLIICIQTRWFGIPFSTCYETEKWDSLWVDGWILWKWYTSTISVLVDQIWSIACNTQLYFFRICAICL